MIISISFQFLFRLFIRKMPLTYLRSILSDRIIFFADRIILITRIVTKEDVRRTEGTKDKMSFC